MARKYSFTRLFALFLLVSVLLCPLFHLSVFAEDTGNSPELDAYVATIDVSLQTALANKANALEAEGDTVTSALLRSFRFHAFRIAHVDILYSQVYVKSHIGAAALAEEMVEFLVSNFYLDQLTTAELVTDALVLCYTRTLGDKYASYENEENYVAPEDAETEYVGIGVTVELLDDGYAKVIEVAYDSPAEKAGIRLGDILVAVEGEDFALIGYNKAIEKIRGEEDTEVTVTARRGDELISFTMLRKRLSIRTVSFHMVEESTEFIGYIRITKFDETTFAQFVEAVEVLEENGATSFVFDVRQNPGGRLDVIIAILEYILPDNTGAPIVRLKEKYSTTKIYSILDYYYVEDIAKQYGEEMAWRYSAAVAEQKGYAAALNHSMDKKMTVLCDAYTISAAELFTSCLKDFGLAEIFGVSTYGKGMGQSEISLSHTYAGERHQAGENLACIRISTFYYSPPVSDNYEGVGVSPHHVITLPEELVNAPISDLTYETDLALQAAVAFIESGAPITEGKVDLTQDPPPPAENPESGESGENGENTGNEGTQPPPPAEDPSAPSEPNVPPSVGQEDDNTPYEVSFWIVFSLLSIFALTLFTVGLCKRFKREAIEPSPPSSPPELQSGMAEDKDTTNQE